MSCIQKVTEVQENNEIMLHRFVARGTTDSSLVLFSFYSILTKSTEQACNFYLELNIRAVFGKNCMSKKHKGLFDLTKTAVFVLYTSDSGHKWKKKGQTAIWTQD